MALELIDLRVKITPETQCALIAHARAHAIEKPDLVREILREWAERQIHGARMLKQCLNAKGLAGALEGSARSDQGTSGNAGENLDWDGE
jgi:hypothetical protein